MERINVTANSTLTGQVNPVSFIWQGRAYSIASIGRRWQAKDGLHMLVMTPENRAFHLVFNDQENAWYLIRGGDVPTVPCV